MKSGRGFEQWEGAQLRACGGAVLSPLSCCECVESHTVERGACGEQCDGGTVQPVCLHRRTTTRTKCPLMHGNVLVVCCSTLDSYDHTVYVLS